MGGPRTRYLASNFSVFVNRTRTEGRVQPASPIVSFGRGGRGNQPKNKIQNLMEQAEHGFTYYKKIHAQLGSTTIGSTYALVVESKKGAKRTYTY